MPVHIRTDEETKRLSEVLQETKYSVGDVIVTIEPVTAKIIGQYKNDGWAAVGWEWRIIGVRMDGRKLRYDVVAHSAPKMYWQELRDSQIGKKVGTHTGPIQGPKGKR